MIKGLKRKEGKTNMNWPTHFTSLALFPFVTARPHFVTVIIVDAAAIGAIVCYKEIMVNFIIQGHQRRCGRIRNICKEWLAVPAVERAVVAALAACIEQEIAFQFIATFSIIEKECERERKSEREREEREREKERKKRREREKRQREKKGEKERRERE